MKKLLCILTIVLAAQAGFAQEVTLGPRVGLTSGQVSLEGLESGDRFSGFQVGLFSQIIMGNFIFMPEFLYSRSGGEVLLGNTGGAEVRTQYTFNKLDTPLLIGLKAGPVRFNAGLVFSVVYGAKATGNFIAGTADIADDFTRAMIGYQAGIGVDVWKILVDFKYESSVGPLSESFSLDGQTLAPNTNIFHKQLIFSLGFNLL